MCSVNFDAQWTFGAPDPIDIASVAFTGYVRNQTCWWFQRGTTLVRGPSAANCAWRVTTTRASPASAHRKWYFTAMEKCAYVSEFVNGWCCWWWQWWWQRRQQKKKKKRLMIMMLICGELIIQCFSGYDNYDDDDGNFQGTRLPVPQWLW